jgi:hypothetical protein
MLENVSCHSWIVSWRIVTLNQKKPERINNLEFLKLPEEETSSEHIEETSLRTEELPFCVLEHSKFHQRG